jgi:hypothetical protein
VHILGITIASRFFGRGGGRRGGHGRDHGGGRGLHIVDDRPPLPRPPRIHFTHGIINLPNGDQSRICSKHSNILSLYKSDFYYKTNNIHFITCRISII